MNTHANKIKNCLFEIIKEMASDPQRFVKSTKSAFSRKRKFSFETLIELILSLGSNSLGHEIGEFFEYKEGFPTVSAFVQQRKKLDYTALKYLFHEFNARSNLEPTLYKGYRLLAIDGSDLSLPYHSKEDNVIGNNHSSTLHLNAAFDVGSKQFVDAIVQKGLKEIYSQRWGIETGFREVKYILGLRAVHSKQENSILQEIYARLIMYNFSMCITTKTPPKEKNLKYQIQVNFTQATKICLHFFKYRGLEPPYDIETTIQQFLLPIRPNRQRRRIAVSTCVISFNYRLA